MQRHSPCLALLRLQAPALNTRELASIIEQEQARCSFLRFQISIEAGAGAITLEVTGRPELAKCFVALECAALAAAGTLSFNELKALLKTRLRRAPYLRCHPEPRRRRRTSQLL